MVDAATPAADVQKILAKAAPGGDWPRLGAGAGDGFDVYQGEGLPPGKKSVAFSLDFRAPDRTLTDDEVNAVLARIQAAITADGTIALRA